MTFLFDYWSFEFLTPGINCFSHGIGRRQHCLCLQTLSAFYGFVSVFLSPSVADPSKSHTSISRLERTEDRLSLFPKISHVTLSKPKFTRGRTPPLAPSCSLWSHLTSQILLSAVWGSAFSRRLSLKSNIKPYAAQTGRSITFSKRIYGPANAATKERVKINGLRVTSALRSDSQPRLADTQTSHRIMHRPTTRKHY